MTALDFGSKDGGGLSRLATPQMHSIFLFLLSPLVPLRVEINSRSIQAPSFAPSSSILPPL